MLQRRLLAVVTAAGLALTATAGCGDADASGADGRLDVVVGFYPLQLLAERIGGDAVSVTNLAKPGAEPHDLELSPRQVGEISDAGLVVYLKGFQPQVDEAVAQQAGDRAFDVATVAPLQPAAAGGHEHEGEPEHAEEDGGLDPHVWLDPTRFAAIGDALAGRLGQVDADGAAGVTERVAALRAELDALDREYETGLATCQRREIVTSHTAFGYLAARYDLEQIGITGLSPDEEPSAQRLAAVAEEAREHGATTIFFETLVSPKIAETIAREVGARTAVLDPLEGLPPGSTGDYFSVMRSNLATLRAALGCS